MFLTLSLFVCVAAMITVYLLNNGLLYVRMKNARVCALRNLNKLRISHILGALTY